MDRLQEFSDEPLLRSSLWKSTPVDCPPGAANFINAVIVLKPHPNETARNLLTSLQSLEKEIGTQPKKVVNDSRILDLDLIVFGLEECRTLDLDLPHPRAHTRAFVLQPLAELAPEFVLPGQLETVVRLLNKLHSDEVLERVRLA